MLYSRGLIQCVLSWVKRDANCVAKFLFSLVTGFLDPVTSSTLVVS